MTHALILMKGLPSKRDSLSKILQKLYKDKKFQKKIGIDILYYLISFGWPDFIYLIKCNNIELLKTAILEITKYCNIADNNISTSSIICITPDELKEKKEDLEFIPKKE